MASTDGDKVPRRSGESPSGHSGTDELYCICHGRDNGLFMYQCDVCGEWYHGSCTGLTEYEVEHKAAENVVLCPDCCLEHVPLSDLELMQRRVIKNEIVPGARGIIIKKIDIQNHTDPERRMRFVMLLSEALYTEGESTGDEERRSVARQRAEAAERLIYETAHCDASSKSYLLRTRSVLIAIHESSALRDRVLSGECTAESLAAAEPSTLSVAQNQVSRRRLAEKLRAAGVDGATTSDAYGAVDGCDEGRASPTKRGPSGAIEGGVAKKRSRLASADVVWDGVIERNEKSTHGPCNVQGQYVSGTKNLHRLVPQHVMFSGRFELEELLEYLHQLEHSTSRKFGVLLLDPKTSQDAVHYNTMYHHFMDKRRAGFLKRAPGFEDSQEGDESTTATSTTSTTSSSINKPSGRSEFEAEELYMVPLQRGALLPQFLRDDPFTNRDALAARSSQPRLLLVAVAHNTTIAADNKKAEEAQAAAASSSPVAEVKTEQSTTTTTSAAAAAAAAAADGGVTDCSKTSGGKSFENGTTEMS